MHYPLRRYASAAMSSSNWMAMRNAAAILLVAVGTGCSDYFYEVSDCDEHPSIYRQSVMQLLGQNMQGQVVGAAFVFPSAGGEWAIFLVKSTVSNEVRRVQFDKSLWGAGNYEQSEENYGTWSRDRAVQRVSVQSSNVDVGPEALDQIRDVFGQVAKAPRRTAEGGMEGTTYEIHIQDGSCAAIWSPSRNLHAAYFVSFIDVNQ